MDNTMSKTPTESTNEDPTSLRTHPGVRRVSRRARPHRSGRDRNSVEPRARTSHRAEIDTPGEIVTQAAAGGLVSIVPGTYQLTEVVNITKAGTKLESDGARRGRRPRCGSRKPRGQCQREGNRSDHRRDHHHRWILDQWQRRRHQHRSRRGPRTVNSTVTGNTAGEGGGINNDGTITVTNSTVDTNTATGKGGGLRDTGKTTVLNSTFSANVASQGGALSIAGTATVTHATIVGNIATSSSSAGVDRNGGSLTVSYSIIGGNFRTNGSPASDCSGTPQLTGLNLVSNSSGCNPVGPIFVAPPTRRGASRQRWPHPHDGTPRRQQSAERCLRHHRHRRHSYVRLRRPNDQRGTKRPDGNRLRTRRLRASRAEGRRQAGRSTRAATPASDSNTVEVGVVSVPSDKIATNSPSEPRLTKTARSMHPACAASVCVASVCAASPSKTSACDRSTPHLSRTPRGRRTALDRTQGQRAPVDRLAFHRAALDRLEVHRASLHRSAIDSAVGDPVTGGRWVGSSPGRNAVQWCPDPIDNPEDISPPGSR